ncbi:MAG: polysaccharide pyruvyl transferase CsaB, partial [Clostridia bacterium]|nr:polysaccharide pyruvyl transferase CsaB [Clostridia bacterium]
FVGVSRAALEARAAEKPGIIAGKEGYIGLFDDSKLQVGIDTNFCCRGCEESSAALLKRDILDFFNMPADKQQSLGVYGRELIKKDYSVSRMADDSIKVYDWATQKNKEILISGYYGFKNSGVDALLNAIIEDIKRYKESPNIVVLSANPKETKEMYHVKAINRLDVIRILKHMKKAEMLISGGGTLIQDRTSTKSLWYYLTVIKAALRKNLKVMLYSNGIGPLERKSNIKKTKKILDKVDLITLRDERSLDTLKAIGVENKNIIVTADPALELDISDKERGRKILDELGVPKDRKLLGVSIRRWRDNGSEFEDNIAWVCDYAYETYGYHTVLLPMQTSKDMTVLQNVKRSMKHEATLIDRRIDVADTMSIMKNFDVCIGMRLHTLIYAVINAIPLIGLVYDPKISSFMEYTNQTRYLSLDNAQAENIIEILDETVASYDEIKASLVESYKQLNKKARLNGRLAVDLYEKGSVSLEG